MSSDTLSRRPFVGARMRHGWQWIWQQIVAGVLAAGYDDVTAAHIGMFRHPTLDGQRPTQLADQLQITKQSVNDLLGHLEHAGYITRHPDPTDGRARIIRLTAKGNRLEQTVRDQAQAADQQIAELLGTQRYAQLCIALEELSDRLATNPMSNAAPLTSSSIV